MLNKIATLALILSLAGCNLARQKGAQITEGEKTPFAKGNVVNLEQGWTDDSQEEFYFTDQGSRIMPYEWLLALEQASSQDKYLTDENIIALRYLPAKPSTWNPDGLPVGFIKSKAENGESSFGLNCAACHTTQIRYGDTHMRIDGGPTMGNFEELNATLVSALSETSQDTEKFDRFAKAVLGDGANSTNTEALRESLSSQTEALAHRNLINHSGVNQPHYGFGRLDAVGAIFNKVMVNLAGVPENARASDAPASYPFIWGTHQSDFVQWTGFAPNGPATVGALIRNGGEVVGVYGEVDIPESTSAHSYTSSLQLKNLGKLEAWVAELRSPAWPAKYLPAVDPIKAAKGEIHFDKLCISCHAVVPRDQEGENYKAVLTPISELGTDPGEWNNMIRLLDAGNFEGRKEGVLAGGEIPNQTTGLMPLVNSVVGSALKHPVQTVEAILIQIAGGKDAKKFDDSENENNEDVHPQLASSLSELSASMKAHVDSLAKKSGTYKARPLNGIWATAPYLHNGSVPNLYELLLPDTERSTTFYVGSRLLDVEKVGFVSDRSDDNTFMIDTSLKGNSNAGHEYGWKLSDVERMELVEFMKTL